MAQYTVERFNATNGMYEQKYNEKIDDAKADAVVAYLADYLDVQEFYRHIINYSDGRTSIKYSSYYDVLGMLAANMNIKKKDNGTDTDTKEDTANPA
jgi:PhoPQ-activated pathogenicity-related protein